MKYMGWSRVDLAHAWEHDIDVLYELIEEEARERERQKYKK